MIRSSLLQSSKSTAPYISNEPLYDNKAIKYGHIEYVWNTRFISLLDDYFLGNPITHITKSTQDYISDLVAFANGELASTDVDYKMIDKYNAYLATII